jgi:hypothetical protein
MTSSKLTRRASRSNDIPNSERPPLPKQVRCLVFSREEIFSALVEHRRRQKLPLPSGYVEKIVMEAGEAGTFAYLRICCDADRETIQVKFNNAEIQEALIDFCQSHHIPLAKRGEKKISLHGSSIALIVTVDLKQDRGTG